AVSRRLSALLLSLVLGTGCNSHIPVGPDDGPQIGETGISVPVPPPSLKLAPVQRVDIEGEIDGNAAVEGTRVFMRESRRGGRGPACSGARALSGPAGSCSGFPSSCPRP